MGQFPLATKHSLQHACHACGSDSLVPIVLCNKKGETKEILRCNACFHAFSVGHAPDEGVASGDYGMIDGVPPKMERDAALASYLFYSQLLKPGDTILDFGAGWGGLSLEIEKLVRAHALGCQQVCVEAFAPMQDYIRRASQNAIRVEKSLDALEAGHFDCIICKEVIEHLDEPAVFLSQLRRLAKSGALLFLTSPGNPYRHVNAMHDYFNYYVKGHVHFFNKQSMIAILRRCGFDSIHFTYIDDFYPEHATSKDFQEKVERTLKGIGQRFAADPWHLQVVCSAR